MKKIILINGKSGSGKDQVATYMKEILEQHNKLTCILHFADPVKFFLKQCYGWNGEKDASGRFLLQHLGTTVMRRKFPRYWGNLIAQFLSATEFEWDYAIVPDWRFLNELQCMKRYNKNVVTLKIYRYDENGEPYINPNLTEKQRNHISETELDDYCPEWYINNDGSLEDLKENVNEFLKEIGAI